MFGREPIRKIQGLVQIGHDDETALPFHRGPGHVAPVEPLDPALGLLVDRQGKMLGCRDEHGPGERVVLRLGEQVCGAEGRVGGLVGNDERFSGPVEAVDSHVAVNELLRQRPPRD